MPNESRRLDNCSNCENHLEGDYCFSCGQSAFEHRVSLKTLFGDFFRDHFHLNSKSIKSLALMFTKPGEITRQYLDGRRVSFINPLRLYLILSILFFFVAKIQTASLFDNSQEMLEQVTNEIITIDSTGTSSGIETDKTIPDSLVADKRGAGPIDLNFDGVDSELGKTSQKVITRVMNDPVYRKEMALKGLDSIPPSAFFLLPFFAFLLKLLYFRRSRFYAEHFIHALHLHAVMFLLLIVGFVIDFIPLYSILPVFFLYMVLSMRNVYKQSWLKTIFKAVILAMIYLTVFSLVIFLAFFVGGYLEAIRMEGYSIWDVLSPN